MNILFLRGFNNYFNRVVKKYSTLDGYQNNSASYVSFANINFNPNDGVVTELVLGNESQKENNIPLDWENIGTPDYCVCFEQTTIPGTPPVTTSTILSRWFVLESERLRSGQYRLALKRDVVAEHFDTIKESPCFIEKGIVNSVDNPLLFNKESMTYNQIKTDEILLKDDTQCGWIVGYIPKNKPNATDVTNLPTIETTILLEGAPAEYLVPNDIPGLTDKLAAGTNTIYRQDENNSFNICLPSLYTNYVERTAQGVFTGIFKDGVTIRIGSDNKIKNITSIDPIVDQRVSGNVSSSLSSYGSRLNNGSVNFSFAGRFGRTGNVSGITISPQVYYSSSASYFAYDGTPLSSPVSQYSPTNYHTSLFSNINMTTMNDHVLTWSIYSTAVRNLISSNLPLGRKVVNYEYEYNSNLINVSDLNNKYIKIGNDYYVISVSKVGYLTTCLKNSTYVNDFTNQYTDIENVSTSNANIATLGEMIVTVMNGYINSYINLYNTTNSAMITKVYEKYEVTLSLLKTETLSLTNREASDRNHTYDNSADMFAIPYGEITFKTAADGAEITTENYRGLAMGRAIAAAFSDSCYDLQLVPYCPSAIIRNYMSELDVLPLYSLETEAYQVYQSGNNITGFVLWCTASKDTFDVNINLDEYMNISDNTISNSLLYKLSNETQVYRLASPNYNGQFEFSLAKNHGVTKFNVDYTYKPYSPYIHVNPDFGGIYGQDWNDARGLICGGDFSLNHITSYWQTYINNNKNYQQIFDRQIQNMDVNNAIAMEKQEFQATVGTITSSIGGTLGGAMTGATAGAAAGPWGALIGGVVGAVAGGVGSGVASAYGAQKDIDWLQRQQKEARSYAVDMYGYQLGNIQAMPYSLKGTESLTNNNKIWPIIEVYNATSTEVELLKKKIEYNGMTIMAVGNIKDFYTTTDFDNVFIKGQIIRIDSNELKDDFHIADAIYQEINKGVYIPSGGL